MRKWCDGIIPRTILVAVGCFLFGQLSAEAQKPVNPNASQKTRDVLNLLYDLPNRPDHRVILGQTLHVFCSALIYQGGALIQGPGAVCSDVSKHMSDIYNKFGVWVGIVAAEYTDWGNFTKESKIMSAELNPSLIAHSNRGGIVKLHFHPSNPKGGNQHGPPVTWAELRDPGETHDHYMNVLNATVAGLRELRDNGVVVLWQPYHGRDSGSFWWAMSGASAMSQSDYKQMWAHMVDYFNKAGLNNVLYVQDWYYGGRWGDIKQLYVGDSLVDIVGYDSIAGPDGTGVPQLYPWEYDNLLSFGKPIGINQNYPYASNDYTPGDMYSQIVDIRNLAPRIVYSINFDNDHVNDSWNMDWSIAGNLNSDKLVADPWILNAPILDNTSAPPPLTPGR
jgi:mannan endo-1,4-beta-mannosidase